MEEKQVGIWIRVSTDFQVDDESPEVHEQRARHYCKAKGWGVAEVYRLDAISGKTVWDLPETKRMLNDIKSGRITGLVFSRLSRLARNTRELLEFADLFRAANADLVSLAEQIDTSSPVGRLFYTVISAVAQWEREEISSRVAASVPIRAEMGRPLGGAAPYGYKWEDKQLKIDDKEAPIRKLMYEIFIECQRKRTTASRLNALGHRTRKGAKFTDSTVDRLLRDTCAIGNRRANYTRSTGEGKMWIMKPEEDWVNVPCPAIIDGDLWRRCNNILDLQREKFEKKGRVSEYLLSGIVKCSCGKAMYVYGEKSRKYNCKACDNGINREMLYEIYQENLEQYLTGIKPEIFIEEIKEEIDKQENLLRVTLKNRDEFRKKMDDLVNLRLKEGLSSSHFKTMYKPLEEQVSQLEQTIPEIQGGIDYLRMQMTSGDYVLNGVRQLYTDWNDLDFSQKRGIAETVTEYITVGKDSIDIALRYLPSSLQTSQRNLTDLKLPPM